MARMSPEELKTTLLKLHQEGVSVEEMSSRLGKNYYYISARLKEALAGSPTQIIPAAVVANVDERKTEIAVPTSKELAKHFTPAKVYNYIIRKVDTDISFWAGLDKETDLPRKPIALIGESGSGKNFAVDNYAAENNLPLLVVPCDDSQVLRELLGYWRASNGTTIWCEGLLAQFLCQPCVVLFDEVNCLPAGKLFMLHELLANRKLFVKDAPSEQSIVHIHPHARIFLAMNPPEARYSGTNRLNTALTNRVVFVEFPPFKTEEILTTSTGNENIDQQLVQFYMEVSRIIKEQKLRISISKRNIDTIAKAIKGNLDLATAVTQGFINSALATASTVERDALVNTAILIFGASNFKK